MKIYLAEMDGSILLNCNEVLEKYGQKFLSAQQHYQSSSDYHKKQRQPPSQNFCSTSATLISRVLSGHLNVGACTISRIGQTTILRVGIIVSILVVVPG